MSNRIPIKENVKRKLYAESMGRCMNPNCLKEISFSNCDILEIAHIESYADTKNNSFDNLVILCPNCHKMYDKVGAYSIEQILEWKRVRQEDVKKFFQIRYKTFDELSKVVVPLLMQNKIIFENYYLKNRELWDSFEGEILVNNRKIKEIMLNNIELFQDYVDKDYSNVELVYQYAAHVEEFEKTRGEGEKIRNILFPKKINSIFGIAPIEERIPLGVACLEALVRKMRHTGEFVDVVLGIDSPYIGVGQEKIYLNDAPRLRQLYNNYGCFKQDTLKLSDLNFALTYLRNFSSINYSLERLSEVDFKRKKFIFVYKYCFSRADLIELSPTMGVIIVNLHHWNGRGCISDEARTLAEEIDVKLLDSQEFYSYVRKIK